MNGKAGLVPFASANMPPTLYQLQHIQGELKSLMHLLGREIRFGQNPSRLRSC